MYVNILLPCRSFANKAWLNAPLAVGDRAVVRLETTSMNLGQAGEAPRVLVQTPITGTNTAVANGAPLYLQIESVSGSFVFGTTEDDSGYWTAALPPTTIPTTANPSSIETLTYGSPNVLTGRKSQTRSGDRRELRAIRIPTYDVAPIWRQNSCCANPAETTDVAQYYNSEYYLAWREPASTEGFPATITFVSEDLSWPCPTTFVGSPCCPRPVYVPEQEDQNTAVAGPVWTGLSSSSPLNRHRRK